MAEGNCVILTDVFGGVCISLTEIMENPIHLTFDSDTKSSATDVTTPQGHIPANTPIDSIYLSLKQLFFV